MQPAAGCKGGSVIFLNPGVRRPIQQTIGPITLDAFSFSPDGVNTVPVGNVIVTMTPTLPIFSGTLALTGPDASLFVLSSTTLPCVLRAKPTATAFRNYQVQIIATLPGPRTTPLSARSSQS